MATRTVVCPDCSEPLTLGRLSCSNCGSLLASVTGAPRRTRPLRTVVVDEPTWLSDDHSIGWTEDEGTGHDPYEHGDPGSWEAAVAPAAADVEPVAPLPSDAAPAAVAPIVVEPRDASDDALAGRVETPADATPPDDRPDAVLGEPEVIVDVAEPAEPAGVDDNVGPETQLSWVDLRVAAISGDAAPGDPEARLNQELVERGAPSAEHTAAEQPAAHERTVDETPASELEPRRDESPIEPDIPAADPIAVVPDESPADAPSDGPPEVADEPAGAPGDVDDTAEPPPPDVVPTQTADPRMPARHEDAPARPLQPSHTTRSHIDLSDRFLSSSVAPAGWPPTDEPAEPTASESFDDRTAEPPAGAWVPPTADLAPVPAAAAEAAPATSPRRTDLKLDAPDDLPTGFTVVGSGIATLGFLLPWAAARPGSAGWLDRWGLADASYGLVFLAAALLLGLNVVPNRMAAWLRVGVLPLGLGGLLLGLVWPAMLGAAGMQLGAVAVTFAAFLLVAGGVVGVNRARHEGSQRVV